MSITSDNASSELEEERRLAYVGITRAMKELVITSARQRMVRGEKKDNDAGSRFPGRDAGERFQRRDTESRHIYGTGDRVSHMKFGGETAIVPGSEILRVTRDAAGTKVLHRYIKRTINVLIYKFL